MINNNEREHKGKSLWAFPADYTVVDIETTGLSPRFCEIIEISAVRYRNDELNAVFSTLVKPSQKISPFITKLTGITNEMADSGADITTAMRRFKDFVGDDVLLGYNVNFDINFLYDNAVTYLGEPLKNDFVDVLRFARRALPQALNHRQTTVAQYLGFSAEGAHRAETDCKICREIYAFLRDKLYAKVE